MMMPNENKPADPDQRAFTGGADKPPQQPDQPPQGNEELTRSKDGEDAQAEGDAAGNPHGDYPSLPGYGG
jgi:hypothetical protein